VKRFLTPSRHLGLYALLLVCFAGLTAPDAGAADPAGEPPADIEVFVREGCPHCAAAKLFLDDLRRERPELSIVIRDIARIEAGMASIGGAGTFDGIVLSGIVAAYLA
jgi:hypothetical protein